MTRARILLLADESEKEPGKTDKEISEALGVCMRTVA
ncbi:MAG TPA: helix-turn-helix domain-containing protein [Candidatus Syntrophoarchaeum butanivorans]|uniref:Helix-turn-helix domain-containing protein n=1 Tax=Candidatus Syntropharchaeum butanivorans TaxID=1839936 RepID=A0A7J2S2Z9_9EURY|nr:helix-turn-helix domain-containing protein [Candidatus Syntrophoarchaeum butanivorans]